VSNLIYSLTWIAGITFAPFVFVESIISDELKKRLSDFLKSNSDALDNLPPIAAALFERMFGKSHFSLRCLFASVAASTFFLALMYVLRLFLIVAAHKNGGVNDVYHYVVQELEYPFASEVRTGFAVSMIANLILDFFGLLKTRLIIRFLVLRKTSVIMGLMVALVDLLFSFMIFQVFYLGFYFFGMIRTFSSGQLFLPAADLSSLSPMIELLIILRFATFPGYPSGTAMQFIMHSHVIGVVLVETLLPVFLTSVFFYASVAPSIWLWLFVLAGVISRLIAPSWPSALYVLNFERAPLKMIGLIASVLAALSCTFGLFVLAIGIATLSTLLN
jgi:hypothetical protein